MADGIFVLPVNHPIALPSDAADRLIKEGDGEAALLYVYILRAGGRISVPDAAAALGRTVGETKETLEKLCGMGLAALPGSHAPAAPITREEPPEYTAKDVENTLNGENKFAPLVHEVQQLFGKVLSGGDLLLLLSIYDYLGLPEDVILLLVRHSIEEYQEKFGAGRVPTMRTIEKKAAVWAKNELFTYDAAEAYIKRRQEYRSREAQLRRTLGISDRGLSPSETRYVEAWFKMGFEIDALALAYDRTVLKTGKLSWAYMNTIVCSWDAKGLHSAKEVEENEPSGQRTYKSRGEKTPKAGELDAELEQLRREIDRMNGKN